MAGKSGERRHRKSLPVLEFFFHKISFIGEGALLSFPFNTYYFQSKDQNKLLKNYLAIPFLLISL